jgi:hypothetical protein
MPPRRPTGCPLHRDIAAEKAAAQLYKDAWAAGSNSTWMTPAFDPPAGLIFVGTGNPAPGDVDLVRPGDNLTATASRPRCQDRRAAVVFPGGAARPI